MKLSSEICPSCGQYRPPSPLAKLPAAFIAGFIAADEDKSSSDNPHDRHTPDYDSWLRGYEERTAQF